LLSTAKTFTRVLNFPIIWCCRVFPPDNQKY
jgi:hypothetical protein